MILNDKIQDTDILFVVLVIKKILQKWYCIFPFMIFYDILYNVSKISQFGGVIAKSF